MPAHLTYLIYYYYYLFMVFYDTYDCIADTITLKYYGVDGTDAATDVGLLNTNIAWSTDKEVKFDNPSSKYVERMDSHAKNALLCYSSTV